VSLDPMGMLLLQGYGMYTNYFKDALDKLGVQVNVFRVGEYKSAVEPFLRNDMSPEARLANQAWLGDLWDVYGQYEVRLTKADGGWRISRLVLHLIHQAGNTGLPELAVARAATSPRAPRPELA